VIAAASDYTTLHRLIGRSVPTLLNTLYCAECSLMWYGTVQCRAVQCSAVQCSVVLE
jgi:hypothetical protein